MSLAALLLVGHAPRAGVDADIGSTGKANPGIAQFGADLNGNGVPDRLDSYVRALDKTQETKAAVAAFFRISSKFAARVLAGQHLTEEEKKSVFDAVNCILLLDESKSPFEPEYAFMETEQGFRGMKVLQGELSGTGYVLGEMSKSDCELAIRKNE